MRYVIIVSICFIALLIVLIVTGQVYGQFYSLNFYYYFVYKSFYLALIVNIILSSTARVALRIISPAYIIDKEKINVYSRYKKVIFNTHFEIIDIEGIEKVIKINNPIDKISRNKTSSYILYTSKDDFDSDHGVVSNASELILTSNFIWGKSNIVPIISIENGSYFESLLQKKIDYHKKLSLKDFTSLFSLI